MVSQYNLKVGIDGVATRGTTYLTSKIMAGKMCVSWGKMPHLVLYLYWNIKLVEHIAFYIVFFANFQR